VQGFLQAIAYIGGFSYSMYLCHIPWLLVLTNYNLLSLRYVGVFFYIAGAIVVGIVTSKLVEIPVLRLRERVFPARGRAAAARLTTSNGKTSVSMVG